MTTRNVETRVVPLKGMTRDEMISFVEELGEPAYRAEQLMRWVYQKDADTVHEMTNLSKALRARLENFVSLERLEVVKEERSRDGTVKLLLRLADGYTVESVLIPEGKRRTACISSQAGCGIGCTFCATALGGFNRNLTAGEIVDQIASLERTVHEKITNVVFMGMGEPFANYDRVIKAARILNDPFAFDIGARHITISTSGVVPAIEKFVEDGRQFVLAISLHGGTDEVRDQLVPLNRKYPIAELMRACRDYSMKTGRRVTFEYVMIRGVNDGVEQARSLLKNARDLLCHVNLIPLNPVPETGFERSTMRAIEAFAAVLEKGGISTTVRRERGADIEAACGQLRRSAGVKI